MSELKTPEEWQEITGIHVMDPDGWRQEGKTGSGKIVETVGWETPITEEEFRHRAASSSTRRRPAQEPAVEAVQPSWDVPPMDVWPYELQGLRSSLRGTLTQRMNDRHMLQHIGVIEDAVFKAYSMGYQDGRQAERDDDEYPDWMKKFTATIGQPRTVKASHAGTVLYYEYLVRVPTYVGTNLMIWDPSTEDHELASPHTYGYTLEDGVLLIHTRMNLSGWTVELKQ